MLQTARFTDVGRTDRHDAQACQGFVHACKVGLFPEEKSGVCRNHSVVSWQNWASRSFSQFATPDPLVTPMLTLPSAARHVDPAELTVAQQHMESQGPVCGLAVCSVSGHLAVARAFDPSDQPLQRSTVTLYTVGVTDQGDNLVPTWTFSRKATLLGFKFTGRSSIKTSMAFVGIWGGLLAVVDAGNQCVHSVKVDALLKRTAGTPRGIFCAVPRRYAGSAEGPVGVAAHGSLLAITVLPSAVRLMEPGPQGIEWVIQSTVDLSGTVGSALAFTSDGSILAIAYQTERGEHMIATWCVCSKAVSWCMPVHAREGVPRTIQACSDGWLVASSKGVFSLRFGSDFLQPVAPHVRAAACHSGGVVAVSNRGVVVAGGEASAGGLSVLAPVTLSQERAAWMATVVRGGLFKRRLL